MPTYGGWTGKTLRVDLTTRTSTVEDTLVKYKDFWGGTGMAYKVLWDETTADTHPFDPECPIIFGWGPLTGTGAPSGGRTAITSLSAQHPFHAVTTGHMGGHFSAEAKFAGWDGIIVVGKADGPVYIAIRDDKVEVVDCPHLWGNGIYRATAEITQAMGGSCQVAAIGQAGENLVAQSVVMTNYSHSAGGIGANLGSKNLKAIGVVGTGSVKIAAGKKAWRALIDNSMQLIGSNNQHVVPNSPQPWAEYVGGSSVRWYAKKGQYWGAANPPVETGTCDPHDRQSVGYRCLKSDPGAFAEAYTVRMDGCHSCPIRCHQALSVPTVAKWGVPTTAANTCTGWWGRGLMDNAKVIAGLSKNDANLKSLEAYVVGKHMTDDLGLTNNYGTTDRGWTFVLLSGPAMLADDTKKPTHPLADATTLKAAGKVNVRLSWLQTVLINPAWDWTTLTAAAIGAEYASLAGLTTTAAATTLLGMYAAGDLNCMKEFGRLMAYQVGVFGTFMAGPVEAGLASWETKAPGLTAAYHASAAVQWWANGFPKHHSLENGGQVGGLINTCYNRDAQNHSWSNFLANGLPSNVSAVIADAEFADNGYMENMGLACEFGSVTSSVMNPQKAVAARWSIARKEIMDSTGLCNWMWPWIVSPLKERGYRGDISLESQLFSAATGVEMNTKEFDDEGIRFYTLERALTLRAFKARNMRVLHDQLPPWGLAHEGVATFNGTNYYETHADWELALDLFYAELGFDQFGAPTRATLTDMGLAYVADELALLPLNPVS